MLKNQSFPTPRSTTSLGLVDISGFLNFFESYLSDLTNNLEIPIQGLARDALLSGGKRIRPSLCYYCGSHNPDITKDLLKASAVLEMVHVATLVHDDILDEATLRRGNQTLHNVAGEHVAILLGDALFSYALELATDFPSNRVCRIVSRATKLTCSGEISQTFARGDSSISVPDYFSFIQNKTGELFKAACQIGADLAGVCPNDIELVGEFGLSLGISYQIYDDLVDAFGSSNFSDKTLGTDFQTGKFTLPILMLLNSASPNDKSKTLELIDESIFTAKARSFLLDSFEKHDVLERCVWELNGQVKKIRLIANSLSDTLLAKNLSNFISTYLAKLKNLNNLKISNFLAGIYN